LYGGSISFLPNKLGNLHKMPRLVFRLLGFNSTRDPMLTAQPATWPPWQIHLAWYQPGSWCHPTTHEHVYLKPSFRQLKNSTSHLFREILSLAPLTKLNVSMIRPKGILLKALCNGVSVDQKKIAAQLRKNSQETFTGDISSEIVGSHCLSYLSQLIGGYRFLALCMTSYYIIKIGWRLTDQTRCMHAQKNKKTKKNLRDPYKEVLLKSTGISFTYWWFHKRGRPSCFLLTEHLILFA